MKKLLMTLLVVASLSNAHPECCESITLENVKACVAARLEKGETFDAILADMCEAIAKNESVIDREELEKINEYLVSQIRCASCNSCNEWAADIQ